jgi:hypothetical protein
MSNKQEYNNLNYGGGFTEEDIKRNSIKKQETLEEAAERYAESKSSNFSFRNTHIRDFIAGAKLQAERMYSEEEVETIAKDAYAMGRNNILIEVFNKWVSQFIKQNNEQ